jgi:hypothetical protein
MVDAGVGSFHDDGIYVANAKALAEGRGYRSINLPGAPYQTKYPPLFSSLLAVVWLVSPVFPVNALALKWVAVGAMGAAALTMSLFLIRWKYASPGLTLAAGLLVWTSPFTAYFGSQILSEMPFAVALGVALWWAERANGGRRSVRTWLVTGGLITIPALIRVVGVSLIPAAVVRTGIASRYSALVMAAGAGIIAGPWLLWSILRSTSSDPVMLYYSDYTWAFEAVPDAASTMLVNARLLAHSLSPFGFDPLFKTLGSSAGALLMAGCVWGIAADIRRRGLLGYFLLSYLAMCLVWPWPPGRFVVPIAHPLIALAFRPLWMRRSRSVKAALWMIVGLLCVFNAQRLWMHHQISAEDNFAYVILPTHSERVSWTEYGNLFRWIQENTAEDAVIASGMDTMLYLYTGRPAYRPFPRSAAASLYAGSKPDIGPAADLWAAVVSGGARYLVLTPMPWFMEEETFQARVRTLEERQANELRERYVGLDSRFRVLEVIQQ